ncbi:hypothetical protein K432DRAFT_3274 [Lepidopterella palustris CBS 459.81]|uniref:Uncharacterized protein n=1 Tax=Lepidopterella palustris CBS 459.81 TaxID=1314670 RepID=A0A8E2EKN5_9PEZI|nr:hypothetical protein K432DRAFT_3274 [Lepidopterella palustris CBS 459.81]
MDESSSPASLSTAALEQNSVVHTPLGEWLANSNRDIYERFAANSSLPGNPSATTNPGPHTQSHGSSMARTHLHLPSTASAYTPSLLYSEATPTESSVSTGLASRFSGVPLLEEVDGVLERRPIFRQPVFECAFWFLSCSYISHNEDEWRTHCLSHFRGEEPPKLVQCPLCEEFKATFEQGQDAWNARMDHVAYHHLLGQTLKTSRPDFHLFQYLWQKRLIDDADLKELKGGNHNLTRAPLPYVTTNGRGRRRDHGPQRSQHLGFGRQRQ